MQTVERLSWRQRILHADTWALTHVQRWRAPALTRTMRSLTHLGDGPSWITMAMLLMSMGGEAGVAGGRLARAGLLATVVAQGLKRWLRRPRPSTRAGFIALVDNPDAFSFPSGHTAAAFAIAIALAGTGASSVLVPLACAIGLSRVYLGAHYPLDVLAGGLLGMGCGVTTVLLT